MWAETAPFLMASPFFSLNLTEEPSFVPALAKVEERTPTPIPPTPLMNALHVSVNSCRAGGGILSKGIFLTRGLGGLCLVTTTFSKEGQAMIFVQYVSETHVDWSIPIFSP